MTWHFTAIRMEVRWYDKTHTSLHSYDIIYGPIANDDIGFQMRRIDANLIDWVQFVKELEHKGGETYQYFFGTERSLKYLRKLWARPKSLLW